MVSYQRRNKRTVDIHSNLESRVTGLESAVEHIESSMFEIKNTLATGLSDIHDRLDEHTDKSKPNIVAWAGWAGVFLIIIGMFGSGYIRDLNRLQEDTAHLQIEQHEQMITSTEISARHDEKLKTLERKVFPQKIIVGMPQ